MMTSESVARVVSLHIYPIKSCGAIDLQTMTIGPRGPVWDRGWMIVDATSGEFLTQREYKELALVRTQLAANSLRISIPLRSKATISDERMEFSLSLDQELENAEPDQMKVKVWRDECEATPENKLVSSALSEYLKRDVVLVRMAKHFRRNLDPKYSSPDDHTGFADGFPFLLTSLNSLANLNSRLQPAANVPMTRFRANIVISHHSDIEEHAFAEDDWRQIRINQILFDVAKPCSRCVMINIDQETAERSAEPLKTLASFRRNETNKVLFGQNLIHRSHGQIRVGDEIEVITHSK